jgi:hypothetical protein
MPPLDVEQRGKEQDDEPHAALASAIPDLEASAAA